MLLFDAKFKLNNPAIYLDMDLEQLVDSDWSWHEFEPLLDSSIVHLSAGNNTGYKFEYR